MVRDAVLLLSQPLMQQKSAKLHFRYLGHFLITKCLRDNVFEIESKDGRKKLKVVNAMNLKKYYPREDFKLNCERQVESNLIEVKSSDTIYDLSTWSTTLYYLESN